MRIGINGRLLQKTNTGVQFYIKNLYGSLIQIDNRNEYIFFQAGISDSVIKKNRMIPTVVGDILYDNLLVSGLIQKHNINIYHSPGGILPFYKMKGIKYVMTVHDLAFKLFPYQYPKAFNLYFGNMLERSLAHADLIVSVSENTKRDLISFYGVSEEKVKVVHSGVSKKFLTATKFPPLTKNPYFFSLATQPKRKNIEGVLKAIVSNPKIVSNHKYLIAGVIDSFGFSYLRELIQKYDLQDKVEILGYVSDSELVSLYQNSSFFIYPSFYEGFGFPILESMCCKCPVIASKSSSIPEIVPNRTWLVDPASPTDIGSKIESMLKLSNKERTSLIEINYRFAKNFTWEKTAQQMLECFKGLENYE